jgi:hypothetical protein
MDRQLARYRDKYRDLQAQIADLGFISTGSVVERLTTCGKLGCRCTGKPPLPHGPYFQWTRKLRGKTVTRRLTAAEALLYGEWTENARRLSTILANMETVSEDAAEILLSNAEVDDR